MVEALKEEPEGRDQLRAASSTSFLINLCVRLAVTRQQPFYSIQTILLQSIFSSLQSILLLPNLQRYFPAPCYPNSTSTDAGSPVV